MNVIHTAGLTKKFGNTTALDDVSISIEEGEIYGFLGVNGAGKTTTIRILLGMIKPDSGTFSLFGQSRNNISWNNVGYLVEVPHAYPDLTVRENINLFSRLRGISDPNRTDEIIEQLHLTEYQHKKARYLSLGNNQRLGIAKALVHKPKLLILDEPVNGLDPVGIVEIRKLLIQLSVENKTTILLSSHILTEIARIANRIGIIHKGRLLREINVSELECNIIRKLLVRTENNSACVELLNASGFEANINGSNIIEVTGNEAVNHPERISKRIMESGLQLKMLNVFEEDLESYFLRVIRENQAL